MGIVAAPVVAGRQPGRAPRAAGNRWWM